MLSPSVGRKREREVEVYSRFVDAVLPFEGSAAERASTLADTEYPDVLRSWVRVGLRLVQSRVCVRCPLYSEAWSVDEMECGAE